MLKNRWYVVLESTELPQGRPVAVTRLDRRMVLWRDSRGRPAAIVDRCCHRGAALSLGACQGDTLECPFHGFTHDPDGRVTRVPAQGRNWTVPDRFKVDAWPTEEAHGFIWLWYGPRPEGGLPPLPFFPELVQGWSWRGSSIRDPWPVHYTRAIENQLDVVHLPFVHRSTIGRGGRTLVHGPRVQEVDGGFDFWVQNVVDDGQTTPLKPDEVDPATTQVSLGFRLPHLWTNRLGDKVRIFAAFVPVDAANTVIYIRMYQKIFTVPGLDRVFNWLGKWMNLRILREDRRVVVTQEPVRTWLTMGENLIQGDLPIVTYRKLRRAALQEHGEVDG